MEESTKYKPFNLEKAKIGKPICTKDGHSVRIVCFDRKDELPILALVKRDDGTEAIASYDNEGRYYGIEDDDYDLVMALEKHEGWINIYRNDNGYGGYFIHPTKEEAIKESCNSAYITTTKITWEE